MLRSDTTNNMSGGVYVSGWLLVGMGIRLWPGLFWGPLGILCGVYTLVGAIWTYDTFRRWKWSLRKTILVMLAIPVAVVGAMFLLPAAT